MNEALELAILCEEHMPSPDAYLRIAAILCSQHAEIEGWKKDQKENLRNQCDLHAEIERVTTSATQNAEAAVKAEAALEAALQSEQQAVADERAKWEQELIDVNEDARNYQAVHNQWLNKTQWVQDDVQSGRLPVEYLGLHRADVIRLYTDALRAENQKLRKALEVIHWSNDSKWQSDCALQALGETK